LRDGQAFKVLLLNASANNAVPVNGATFTDSSASSVGDAQLDATRHNIQMEKRFGERIALTSALSSAAPSPQTCL
jgi:hypothetical protein